MVPAARRHGNPIDRARLTSSPWYGAGVFVALTACLSAIFWTLIIATGTTNRLYIGGLMWMPAIAAMLSCRLLGRPLTILGWRWNGRFAVIAYLIPVAYCLAGLVLIVVVGLGGFPDTAYLHQAARSFGFGPIPDGAAVALLVALQGSAGMIYSVATAAGEELGWRGFLVPELARKLSFTPVAVLSGLVWATWHYPVFALLFPPGNGVPMWFSLPTFTSAAVAVSFAQAWLRLRTDSVWPPIVLHASHNVWMQAICTPLIIEKPSTKWVAGEPGLVFVALSALVAAVFWAKRKELTEPKAASSSPIQTGIDDDGRRSE